MQYVFVCSDALRPSQPFFSHDTVSYVYYMGESFQDYSWIQDFEADCP